MTDEQAATEAVTRVSHEIRWWPKGFIGRVSLTEWAPVKD